MLRIVTPGRSGSHVLLDCLNQNSTVSMAYADVTHDISPTNKNKGEKVIFITDDPRIVVRKIFAIKDRDLGFYSTHLSHMGITPFPAEWTLSDYLDTGKDLMLLDARYTAWMYAPREPMALLVTYQNLWEEHTWARIGKYLSIDTNIPETIQEKKESGLPEINTRYSQILDEMYEDLANLIKKDEASQ